MKRVEQMRIRPGMTVGELAEEMRRAGVIGAGRVGNAVEIVAEMFSDPDYTTFITLSGPLVPSGMRLIFRDLIRDDYVDAVVSNGANLVHDIVRRWGEPTWWATRTWTITCSWSRASTEPTTSSSRATHGSRSKSTSGVSSTASPRRGGSACPFTG